MLSTLLLILGIIAGVIIGGAIVIFAFINYLCDGFWKDLSGGPRK